MGRNGSSIAFGPVPRTKRYLKEMSRASKGFSVIVNEARGLARFRIVICCACRDFSGDVFD